MLLHDRDRTHVVHQRVVAEADAALRHQHIRVARIDDLVHDILHVPGREELTLLDVHDPAGPRRSLKKVGLTAEESRYL